MSLELLFMYVILAASPLASSGFWKLLCSDPEFFGLKPSRDQDGANKKKV